jgi:hypothetical protein
MSYHKLLLYMYITPNYKCILDTWQLWLLSHNMLELHSSSKNTCAFTFSFTDCGPLADIVNGTVSAASTTHGSTGTYSCQYGYEHTSGNVTRSCVDGIWDGIEMTCTIKGDIYSYSISLIPRTSERKIESF